MVIEDRRNIGMDRRSIESDPIGFHWLSGEGVPMTEKRFIDESVNRNQLTGNQKFVDEIERRIGIRVERRGRGRPSNEEK